MNQNWIRISLIAGSLIFAACNAGTTGSHGGTPKSDLSALNQSTTPLTTTGAGCASAARSEFVPGGQLVGLSGLKPGTYVYVNSQNLYIAESQSLGTMIEGHVVDSSGDGSKFTSSVDCHSDTGLKSDQDYAGHMPLRFPMQIQISQSGEMTTPQIRHLDISQLDGAFSVDSSESDSNQKVESDDLKKADATFSSQNPNQIAQIRQDDDGGVTMLLHQGYTDGVTVTTQDSAIHYTPASN